MLKLKEPFGSVFQLFVLGTVAVAAFMVWFSARGEVLADVVIFVLVFPLVGALLWAILFGLGNAGRVAWGDGWNFTPVPRSSGFTNKTVIAIEGAASGMPHGADRVADMLLESVEARLVLRHRADPQDPLASAHEHLSPELYRYLATVLSGESTPPLPPRTLRSYMKEIESL